MKKTCEGCRAFEPDFITNYGWRCSLGYSLDQWKGIPMEECPKPRTIGELVNTPHK